MSSINNVSTPPHTKASAISVEFSGGLELLMDNQKRVAVPYPWSEVAKGDKEPSDEVKEAAPSSNATNTTLQSLITYISQHVLTSTDRTDLFLSSDKQTVRPGILVLVDDTDWELLGGIEYEVQPNDRIVFISTLHGG